MLNADSRAARVFASRARVYARCAFALQADPYAAGAESLFDAALNNGLAVVVGSGWRGEELETTGSGKDRVKFARALLALLATKARGQETSPVGAELAPPQVRVDAIAAEPDAADGSVETVTLTVTPHLTVPRGQHRARDEALRSPLAPRAYDHAVVRIEIAILTEAITFVNAIRHGNHPDDTAGDGALERRHLDALLALDKHPSLGVLGDEEIDAHERGDTAADRVRVAIAEDYLSVLDDDEIARRVEAAGWFDPAPGDGGEDLQDCPVCEHTALIAQGIDAYAAGIVTGVCLVCGYRRSQQQADREAMGIMLDRHLDD